MARVERDFAQGGLMTRRYDAAQLRLNLITDLEGRVVGVYAEKGGGDTPSFEDHAKTVDIFYASSSS